MNAKELIKETIIDNGRTAYTFTFDIINTAQAQGEKTLNTVLDQAPWITNENRKAVDTWLEAVKDGQNNVKNVLDENLKTFERLVGGL